MSPCHCCVAAILIDKATPASELQACIDDSEGLAASGENTPDFERSVTGCGRSTHLLAVPAAALDLIADQIAGRNVRDAQGFGHSATVGALADAGRPQEHPSGG